MNLYRLAFKIVVAYLITGAIASLLGGCLLPLVVFGLASFSTLVVAKALHHR